MPLALRSLRSALLLLGLALPAHPASAGIDRFTPFGPMNGRLESLAVDPRHPATLLAAVDLNGVHRSDDGGRTWAWSGIGLGSDLPQALAADPANDERFYAISKTQVFRSSDQGRHWTVVGTGLDFTSPFVFDAVGNLVLPKLLVLPGSPATLLVGAGQFLQRSADGGATWSRVYTADRPYTGWSLAVDPADPRRVWAGLASGASIANGTGGVLASADAGQTWTRLTSFSDPLGQGAAALIALPAPPGQPATLLASSGSGAAALVERSSDDGQTWRPVSFSPPPFAVTALAYEPQTPSIVYAASVNVLFVSSDAGETWQKRQTGVSPQIAISSLVTAPGTRTVYGLGNQQIVGSPDRGRHTKILAVSGQELSFPPRFHFLPGDAATLYVVLGGAVSVSRDGGATWATFGVDAAQPDYTTTNDLAIDPAHPEILYIATQIGIFETLNGGTTWSRLSSEQLSRIELVGRKLTYGTDCGVSRSTDGGRTWKRTLPCTTTLPGDFEGRTVDRLLLAPREPGVLYAELTDVIGRHPAAPFPQIWKSADAGVTWKEIVPDGTALALDPRRPGRLYASLLLADRVERSDDGGRTFRPLSFLPVLDLLVDPATPTTLYGAAGTKGVFRSTDGGLTWQPINAGLSRYVSPPWNADELAVNPAVPHHLYAVVGGWILENQLTTP